MNRFLRGTRGWLVLAALAASAADAQAQNAVITGRVTSEAGQPLQGANVFITEMNISVGTTQTGNYTITVPAARVSGQTVVLRVRSVGFSPQQRNITLTAATQNVDFVLRPDVTRLSEVVVTGVSQATEAIKVPFSVARIDTAQMPVVGTNPVAQLQGKIAGATIVSASGRPGAAPSVILRGPTSINAQDRGQGPVYIIDGVVLQGALPDINPNDIENIEVVKGAAAASLYGARAGAGVINITTKSGRTANEGVRFSVRGEYGQSDIPREFSLARNHWLPMDPSGQFVCAGVASGASPCGRYVDMYAETRRINDVPTTWALAPQSFLFDAGIANTRTNPQLAGLFQANTWPVTYNAVGQATTNAPFTTLNGDMRGRVGNTGFFASVSRTDQEGGFRSVKGFNRTTGRLNLDQRLRDDLSIQLSSFYSLQEEGGFQLDGGAAFFRLSRQPGFVNQHQRDAQGRLFIRSNPMAQGDQNFNPMYWFENYDANSSGTRFLGSGQIRYTPLEWLDVSGDFGYDRGASRTNYKWDRGFRVTQVGYAADALGFLDQRAGDSRSLNTSFGAVARPQVIEGLNSAISARVLFDQQRASSLRGQGENIVVPGVDALIATTQNFLVRSAFEDVRSLSYFGGLDLDYLDRYILNFSLRHEGSSLFGADNRWATFPRVAAAWIASQEAWWPAPEALSLVKFRASVGQAGNRPTFAAQYETYSVGAGGVLNPATLGNAQLKPEIITETEVGADLELFQRFGLNVTYAQSTAKDQILQVPLAAIAGFANQWRNAGELENKTWEVTLDVPLLNRPEMQWSTRLIYDRNRATITKLNVLPYTVSGGPQGAESMYFVREGERLGTIYGRAFVMNCSQLPSAFAGQCGGAGSQFQRNDEGFIVWTGGRDLGGGLTNNLFQAQLPAADAPWSHRLQWGHPILLRDENNSPLVDALGNGMPDYHIGVSSNFSWRRLSLYGLIDANMGRDVWNEGYQWALGDFQTGTADQANRDLRTAKPMGYYWRAGPGIGGNNNGLGGLYDVLGPTSHSVEDASYAKLRELSLNYNIGQVGGQGNWTVGVVGRNLLTWTDYRGYDPEVGRGGGQLSSAALNAVDYFTFPNLRTLTLQVSTSF